MDLNGIFNGSHSAAVFLAILFSLVYTNHMVSFSPHQSLRDFQRLNHQIYSKPDDRMFSINDLLSHLERFTMRSLKGIRKNNKKRLNLNLLVGFSFCMAVCNRLHIDIEDAVWYRFPHLCSYCGRKPCVCKKEKIIKRIKISRKKTDRPNRLQDFQQMFADIYPPSERTLADAGVHLAEETGEVSEAIHAYLGEHKNNHFDNVVLELADWISCSMGVANSADINMALELSKLYFDGCHVCHKTPCSCSFTTVSMFKS